MNLRECYAALDADYEDVMERFLREEVVLRFLRKLEQNPDYERMLTAYEQKDYAGVFTTTHNLKSVCGTLGLKPLAKCFYDICEEVRYGAPGENFVPLVERVQQMYRATIDAISGLEE